MEVLIRLSDIDIDPESVNIGEDRYVEDDIRRDIFNFVKMEYENATQNTESYFYEDYGFCPFLFGLVEPDNLIDRVLRWNDEIRDALCKAMTDVFDQAKANTKDSEEQLASGIVLDTDKTYALSQAAREADNHWFDYAEHAVLLPNSCGYTYFQTILPDEYLKDIQQNPQDYVIVTVYPK